MLPHVILHNGVSLDGRDDWYSGDVGLYYELAARFQADATLSSSNTIVTAFASEAEPVDESITEPSGESAKSGQWLAIVDSRGQVRNLPQLRRQPYWRDVIILCSESTPPSHLDYLREQQVEHLVAGTERVDLRAALAQLKRRYGLNVVRVDSGGTLNGVLLRAGLVGEVSVLINPSLVGGTSARSIFIAPDLTSPEGVIPLKLTHVEQMAGDAVWLRYQVVK